VGLSRRRRASRIGTRLLAIAAIPLLGFGCLAGLDSATRWHTMRTSEQLQSGVQQLAGVTVAANLLTRETYLYAALAYVEGLGFNADVAGNLLHTNVTADLRGVRTQLQRQLAGLAPGDPLRGPRAKISAIETAIDRGAGLKDQVFQLGKVSLDVNALADRELSDVTQRALRADGSAETRHSLAVLAAAHQAAGAVYTQLGQLSGVVFNNDDEYMSALRMATASLNNSRATLNELTEGSVRTAWQRLAADHGITSNEKQFQDLAGSDKSTVNDLGLGPALVRFGNLASNGMTRLQRYDDLVALAGTDAVTQANSQRDQARAALLTALAATAALVLLTLLTTIVVAQSVARPLRRLRQAARRVSTGVLNDPPIPQAGPYELREVTTTFEEVVANLRTVETQVGALATDEVDDTILGHQVPGRLGDLLHASVDRLSRAMAKQEELTGQLAFEARHDALTGLPNRAAATAEITRALARAQRAGTSLAVLHVDLDEFKHVNDNLGQSAGDELLRVAAKRLTECVRTGDFAARIGGDEFLVLTEQAADGEQVAALGQRIITQLSQPIAVGQGGTRVGASVGIAITLEGETQADQVLRDAELAVARAKSAGRGRVEVFDDGLRAEVARQTEIESALREALVRDELEFHFQPVVDADGATVEVEALLRWQRPGAGMVPPGDFIPVAEASDLIIEVGRWVIDRACQHLAEWAEDPILSGLAMAINLSGRHLLDMTVVDDVRAALRRHRVAPERLTVELTETTVLTDLPRVTENLARLRRMGVRVAIDDFGTGHTSLGHLRNLPVDVLKIDRSMIVNAERKADAHVLALLIGTARALGLELVAEGVETPDQLELVRGLGCGLVQGFFYSRPLPAAQLRTFLTERLSGSYEMSSNLLA
jgi:diguanylate cyclase (GGDEF)-like protein